MLGRQVSMLFREPLERHFGLAASAGCLLDCTKPLPVLRPNGGLELGPVRPQQAAEPPNRNPEIVQRLPVERVVEPTFCRARGGKAFERQPSRGFLVAPREEIVRQCASPFGL